jgi:uncharacterized protein YbjT (DUF2867 family)
MPALVIGTEFAAGMAAVRALLRAGGEVRTFLDPTRVGSGTVERLRASGVKTARGTLDDEGFLEQALEQVHTVVHAAADPVEPPGEVLDGAASVLSAALGARCRRLVFISHLGVEEPRGNPWLEAIAEAEEMLLDAPIDTVFVRRALTYGPADRLTAGLVEGAAGSAPDATHAPLWLGDLAAAVAAADARDEAVGGLPHLVVPLGGPELTSLGELIALLGGQITGGLGGTPARVRTTSLPDHALDLCSRDLVPAKEHPRAGTTLRTGAALVREAFGSGPPSSSGAPSSSGP